MTTDKPKAARKTPQRLSLEQQMAHDYNMAVLNSTASFEMLNRKDGVVTRRLVHLGREYATEFFRGAA